MSLSGAFRKLGSFRAPAPGKHAQAIRQGLGVLAPAIAALRPPVAERASYLSEQPFDGLLLRVSPVYRRSRGLYLQMGGAFRSGLVSTPRTLASAALLEPVISYSPIEQELFWVALDPAQEKSPAHLMTIRSYSTSIFHEQNHRLLWKLLPQPPGNAAGIRRYLNLAESLVIVSDMALADELGARCGTGLPGLLHLTGATYDPGSVVKSELRSRRQYRNYLQASLLSTYLALELHDPQEIPGVIERLFPILGAHAARAAKRALHLDAAFIHRTNPLWQEKNLDRVRKRLRSAQATKERREAQRALRGSAGAFGLPETLALPENPLDNRLHYLAGEKWFSILGM